MLGGFFKNLRASGLLDARTRAGRRAIGGAIIVAGLVVVAIAALRPDPFSDKRSYWAEFDSVQGLGSIDRDVRVAGANVGEIGAVERVGDNARVEIVLDGPQVELHTDARADLRPHTLFEGTALIDLAPGSPSAPEMEEGGLIPRENTTVYVSLDEALRILREPVRKGARGLIRVSARSLNGAAIQGLQRTLRNAPELTRWLGPTARAAQGPTGVELAGAIDGLSDTVDDVAAREGELIPLARRANATLGALEVDGGRPLDQALAELPGALEELQRAGPPLARTVEGLGQLAAGVRPAIPDLKVSLKRIRPVLARSPAILKRAAPQLSQLRTVIERISLAAPSLREVIAALLPGARTLANSVLPFLSQDSRLGDPTYKQLISTFSAGTGALRPYSTEAQSILGGGHQIRLGAYLDPASFAGPPISCAIVAIIDPAVAAQLQLLGLCT